PTSPSLSCPLSLHDALPISRRFGSPNDTKPSDAPHFRLGYSSWLGHEPCRRSARRLSRADFFNGGRELRQRVHLGQHAEAGAGGDRKSTRLNSSHQIISYSV